MLKTLGLKAYRVTLLFLVEALLLGLIGSVIGMVLGAVLSYLIRDVGETAFQITLDWRLYPEALVSGLFLGMVMTGRITSYNVCYTKLLRPDALFLNYTNPMAVLTNVMNTVGGIRTVGLCHSVQVCVPGFRITSYNVCYTKLLRVLISAELQRTPFLAFFSVRRPELDLRPIIKSIAAGPV